MIIDDVDSNLQFLSGIFEGRLEHRKRGFPNLLLVMWRGFTLIKARIYQIFLFDVTDYIEYADKRYMRDYFLH